MLDFKRIHVPAEEREHFGDEMWRLADEPTEHGEYLLVMEYAGLNLVQATQAHQIEGNIALIRQVVEKVALALQHMHSCGVIHADVKPANVVRLGKGDWRLIDLEAATEIGETLSGKYSEAYIPPEYMKEIIPKRTDGRWHLNQPRIKASPKQDVWGLGVCLFEICAGFDLFHKDHTDDIIIHGDQRQQLSVWVEPSAERLDSIFQHGVALGQVTHEERVLAIDLIASMLQGKPEQRLSIDQVLSHPFITHAGGQGILPKIMPRKQNTLDVVFSYSTRQEGILRRLRRVLNLVGISTADGSQVPSSADWRIWYFAEFEKASVFVPLLSREYFKSPNCLEEAESAKEHDKPIVTVAGLREAWDDAMQDGSYPERTEFYNKLWPPSSYIPQQGDFEEGDRFFDNCVHLIQQIQAKIAEDPPLVVVAYTQEPREVCDFAETICELFNQEGFATRRLTALTEECNEAAMTLPILSRQCMASEGWYDIVTNAVARHLPILPVTFDLDGYNEITRDCTTADAPDVELRVRLLHLISIFNRANRWPQAAPYTRNLAHNHRVLVERVCSAMTNKVDVGARLQQRVVKYRSMLQKVPQMPTEGSFDSSNEMHIRQLISAATDKEIFGMWDTNGDGVVDSAEMQRGLDGSQKALPKAVVSYAAEDAHHFMEGGEHDFRQLKVQGMQTTILKAEDPAWYAKCCDAEICIVVLSEAYVRSDLCEGQLTFAKDYGKRVLGFMLNRESYEAVMQSHVNLSSNELATIRMENQQHKAEMEQWKAQMAKQKQQMEKQRLELERLQELQASQDDAQLSRLHSF